MSDGTAKDCYANKNVISAGANFKDQNHFVGNNNQRFKGSLLLPHIENALILSPGSSYLSLQGCNIIRVKMPRQAAISSSMLIVSLSAKLAN